MPTTSRLAAYDPLIGGIIATVGGGAGKERVARGCHEQIVLSLHPPPPPVAIVQPCTDSVLGEVKLTYGIGGLIGVGGSDGAYGSNEVGGSNGEAGLTSTQVDVIKLFTKDYGAHSYPYVDDITDSLELNMARLDIAYVVCKLSRYTSNPSQDHWKAIGRVFGYLKRTRQLALYYDHFPAVLEGYSDASWITGSSDSKSTTGWIFTLGGGAVCWGSKKQTCITHSTMEAEFLALAAAGKEAEWLRNMLLDIELWPQPMAAISLHCDSQSMLSRAYNKVYNGKSRHISLRHAYIKELISNGIITIEYIRSCKNLADPFTKGLPKDIVFGTTREMGLKPIEVSIYTLNEVYLWKLKGFTYVDIRSGDVPTKFNTKNHGSNAIKPPLILLGYLMDIRYVKNIMDQSAGLRMFGSDTIKLDRMDGMNFTRWNEKMKFLLTAFKVYYVLEGLPVGVMTEEEQRKREQDETLYRGYILSTLIDRLYDLYTPMTSAGEI
ncbi:hypothetical protein Tco_1033972 [Tanacetum coccineum]